MTGKINEELVDRTIVAVANLRSIVNGEYLLTVVEVVYDVPIPGETGKCESRRRCYGVCSCCGPFLPSLTARRGIRKRISRDLSRMESNGYRIVGEDGAPFPADLVAALVEDTVSL